MLKKHFDFFYVVAHFSDHAESCSTHTSCLQLKFQRFSSVGISKCSFPIHCGAKTTKRDPRTSVLLGLAAPGGIFVGRRVPEIGGFGSN